MRRPVKSSTSVPSAGKAGQASRAIGGTGAATGSQSTKSARSDLLTSATTKRVAEAGSDERPSHITLFQLARLLGRQAARQQLRRQGLGLGTASLPLVMGVVAGLAIALYLLIRLTGSL